MKKVWLLRGIALFIFLFLNLDLAYGEVSLSITNKTANVGSTITVPVVLKNNTSIVSLQFDIVFNNSNFQVDNPSEPVEPGDALKGTNFNVNSKLIEPGRIRVIITPPIQNPLPVIPNGTIITTTIRIKQGTSVNKDTLKFDKVSTSDANGNSEPILTNAGTISIQTSTPPHIKTFSDISSTDWYYTYVQDIAKAGITTGYPDGTYRPSALVTRAQMATFIARALKLNIPDECSSSPFYDIDTNTWYCPYVEAIKDAGVTAGYPDGSYGPNDYATRAQMAAFLVKALHLNKQPCTTKPFVDVPVNAWYCPYVQAIKNAGITKGYPDGTYRPNAAVTRAIMAAFIDKAFLGGDKSEHQGSNSETGENQYSNATSQYIGCFQDSGDPHGLTDRDLSGFMANSKDMTVEKCIQICSEKGFKYAGLQYGVQCFCGNSYGKYGESYSCDYVCSGNQNEICGGYWANSVYSVTENNTNGNNNNVIVNGDFKYGLEDWAFEDISKTGNQCLGFTANSDVKVNNDTAVIHSKYGYGRGKLSQSFDPVKPARLSVAYKAASPSGHCNTVIIYFYDSQGTKVAGLYYGEDSFVPQYSRLIITLLGNDYTLPFNSKYSEGTIEFSFDWDNKKVSAIWHSNTGEEEVLETAPIENDVYVSKVDLMAYNSCCDGRDDAYGYFKDVVVQQYSANASYNSNIGAARKLKCKYAIGYTVFFHTL